MIYRSRIVFTLGALAVASAAAATIRWQAWTPVTACLLCGVQDSGEAVKQVAANSDSPVGTGSWAGSYARSSAGMYTPSSVANAPSREGTSSSSARSASVPKGWQPWGNGSGASRMAASGSGSAPSASLGGLWRLMSLSRPGHGGGTAVAHAPVNHIKPPAASRPVKTPTPHHSAPPSTSSPSVGGTPATSGSETGAVTGGGAPPTDSFHEHEAPPPDPFRGPGGFDPGAPGGGGGKSPAGGNVSPTPEPGSILLMGTGLLGILGVLRKRRVA